MKIAIIGWGSLIWNPRDLPCLEKPDDWQKDGPRLRIEFTRVSRDSRLTLVIDPICGLELTTLYATSTRTRLEDAIADLRQREGTVWKHIGYVSAHANSGHDQNVCDLVYAWLKIAKYDGAVWTALPANYEEQLNAKFSVEHATRYLTNLPEVVRHEALDYVRRAPKQIDTPLRIYLRNQGVLK